ncbi:cadherin-like domain-containing protein [Marinobacter daepoensis]|uniref:cadherin-like domain-containing protein n=1 Tax=Marinobacter daepoensis TaxID=262077 RepID=UPI00040B4051|nr:Ig-like domain-containing protein [Marinobacter daepoensis]MBY6034094.1 cadherin-like domain-containing protein [Marinobacter daepoensis]
MNIRKSKEWSRRSILGGAMLATLAGCNGDDTHSETIIERQNQAPVVDNVDLGTENAVQVVTVLPEKLLESASDPDGDPLHLKKVELRDPDQGRLSVERDDNGLIRSIEFMPGVFRGTHTVELSFQVSDGQLVTEALATLELMLGDRTPKALVVMVDGVRYDALMEAAPAHISQLDVQKAYSGGVTGAFSQSGTSTVEGTSTLWTGAWHASQRGGHDGYPSIWGHLYNNSATPLTLGVYPNWNLFAHVNYPDMEVISTKGAFATGTDKGRERENIETITGYIESGEYDALYTTIDMTDYAGHCNYGNSGGAWSKQYNETIREADELFGQMWKAVQQREQEHNEDWLVIVTTDHGYNKLRNNGTADCSHGSQDLSAKEVWIATNKAERMNEQYNEPLEAIANTEKAGVYRYPALVDVPVTLLSWFDVEPQKEWLLEGTSLIGETGVRGLFAEPVETEDNQVSVSFTATNDEPVVVYRSVQTGSHETVRGQQIDVINGLEEGRVHTYVDELDLEPGNYEIIYQLENKGTTKAVRVQVTIVEKVAFDDLPFNSISDVFTFDDPANLLLNSGDGLDLTQIGQPAISSVAGRFGSALQHQRQFSQDLSFPDAFTSSDKFTLSFWFRGDGKTSDPAILTNKAWSSSLNGTIVAQLNDTLKFQVGATGEGSCCYVQLPYSPSQALEEPEWNLVVASVDRTRVWSDGLGQGVISLSVYRPDGSLEHGETRLSGNRAQTVSTGQPWLINNDHAQRYNGGHVGFIDEVAVWQGVALSAGQAKALGTEGRSVTEKLTNQ